MVGRDSVLAVDEDPVPPIGAICLGECVQASRSYGKRSPMARWTIGVG
jgi:hypothetical protein